MELNYCLCQEFIKKTILKKKLIWKRYAIYENWFSYYNLNVFDFLKISQWLLLIEMYLFILILSATTIRRQLTRTRENMVYMSLTKSLNHDTLSLTGTQSLGLVSSQDQKSQSLLGKLASIIEVDVSCLGVSRFSFNSQKLISTFLMFVILNSTFQININAKISNVSKDNNFMYKKEQTTLKYLYTTLRASKTEAVIKIWEFWFYHVHIFYKPAINYTSVLSVGNF